MKKISTLIVVITIIIISVGFGYKLGQNKKISSILNVSKSAKEQTGVAPSDPYSFIKENDFVQFAKNTIEKRCPFYKPDGATYRECLSDWEQSLEDKVLIEQADEVHAYCSTFTSKYVDDTSLEGSELFLKCSIFKLQ